MSILIAFSIWKYDIFAVSPDAAITSIFTTLPDSIVLCNRDGEIVNINETCQTMLEYSGSEMPGLHITDIILGITKDSELHLDNLKNKDLVKNYETTVRSRNRIIPVEVSAHSIANKVNFKLGYVFIIHDISRKKSKEQLIDKTRAEFEAIFQNNSMGILVENANKEIIRVNKQFEIITGYSESEVLSNSSSMVLSNPCKTLKSLALTMASPSELSG